MWKLLAPCMAYRKDVLVVSKAEGCHAWAAAPNGCHYMPMRCMARQVMRRRKLCFVHSQLHCCRRPKALRRQERRLDITQRPGILRHGAHLETRKRFKQLMQRDESMPEAHPAPDTQVQAACSASVQLTGLLHLNHLISICTFVQMLPT